MIGLTVLGVLLVYVTIAILVTIRVARWIKNRKVKWMAVLVCIVIFILIPTWDEILGRMYFNHLCETEGGVRIYKAVELAPEYWNEDSTPKYLDSGGNLNEAVLSGQYRSSTEYEENYSQMFRIRKTTRFISKRRSHEISGNHVSFLHFRGWFINTIGGHVSGIGCHNQLGFYQRFLQEIFILVH